MYDTVMKYNVFKGTVTKNTLPKYIMTKNTVTKKLVATHCKSNVGFVLLEGNHRLFA